MYTDAPTPHRIGPIKLFNGSLEIYTKGANILV
jgi:hypothetical protein